MNDQKQKTSSPVLITGATGLSGSIIVKELIKKNIPVRILVRNPNKAKPFENYNNVEIVQGDMLIPETLHLALKGVKKALLISSAFEKMVETQERFIDAAKESGVEHVIKFSGAESGIGFNHQNFPTMKEHENIEDYLVGSGLKWTFIRPSQFMQFYLPGRPTGVNMAKAALILPIGNAMLSPIDLEDVAKACMKLLTEAGHEGKIYEMTGPDALNMHEACEIISRVINKRISYFDITIDHYQSKLGELGIPPLRINTLVQLAKERKKCIDSNVKLKTHRLFGVRPTNFAEFIYKNISAFN